MSANTPPTAKTTSPTLELGLGQLSPDKVPCLVKVLFFLVMLCTAVIPVSYITLRYLYRNTGWHLRFQDDDGAVLVLVDEHIAHVYELADDEEWHRLPGDTRAVTLLCLDQTTAGTCAFDLRYNREIVYSAVQPPGLGNTEAILCYYHIELGEEGAFEVLPVHDPAGSSPGTWSVEMEASGYGVMLVNGTPVCCTGGATTGNAEPCDISAHIIPGQPNRIAVSMWHQNESFQASISLYRKGESVWEVHNQPAEVGETGLVEVWIDADGQISPSP